MTPWAACGKSGPARDAAEPSFHGSPYRPAEPGQGPVSQAGGRACERAVPNESLTE